MEKVAQGLVSAAASAVAKEHQNGPVGQRMPVRQKASAQQIKLRRVKKVVVNAWKEHCIQRFRTYPNTPRSNSGGLVQKMPQEQCRSHGIDQLATARRRWQPTSTVCASRNARGQEQ